MPLSGSLITQALVTSEPVPLVVGMATQVSMLMPLCWLNQTIAFAASIAEPPPKPMTTCGRRACICAIPCTTVWIVGSGVISLKTLMRLSAGNALRRVSSSGERARKPSQIIQMCLLVKRLSTARLP